MNSERIAEHVEKTLPLRAAPTAGGSSSGIPSDLTRSAAKRLAVLSLIVAAIVLCNLLLFGPLPGLLGLPELGEKSYGRIDALDLILIAAFLLSFGVYFLSRSDRIPPRRLLDLGLVYEVALAALSGVAIQIAPGSEILRTPNWGVPWICIPILIFPVIVPNTMGKILTASLLAASMNPLGVVVAHSLGKAFPAEWEGLSLAGGILKSYHMSYLCAVVAVVPSRILNRLGREIGRARELGSYQLIEKLGAGGMGEVWRARHRLLAREAAVKIIQPEKLDARSGEASLLLQRFELEAQATAALNSPHTVELYDFGITEEGTFYYVMELLDGVDLETIVRRFGPLPSERVAHVLIQCCHSLADAHGGGLIHRDIKPANIFACRKGLDTDFVKVLDFGLVKSRDSRSEEVFMTRADTLLGTPAFMAPEMIQGAAEYDGRSDLYSLGCVAFWLLTGRLVFEGNSPMDVLIQHAKSDPTPPSARGELEIDPELEGLILECLQKRPEARPESAEALGAALESLSVTREWTPARSREWWRSHIPSPPS